MKTERANVHLDALNLELDRFVNEPNPVITEDYIKGSRYIRRTQFRKIPPIIGMLLGEFLYCLRSGLDQLAWQLSLPTAKAATPKRICFPIFESIANPDHAPYGRAAVEALKNSGLYERVKTKLVFGENISQAAQFTQSGSAQIGILAESFIHSPAFASGHAWKIPQNKYTPLLQSFLVLKTSANKDAALAFLAYVKSPPAQAILEKYGFAKPESIGHPIPR